MLGGGGALGGGGRLVTPKCTLQSPPLQDFLRQCVEVMVVTTMNNVKEVSQGLGWESGKAVHGGGPAQVLSFGSWGSVLMCTPVPARWSPTFQAFLQLWDSD